MKKILFILIILMPNIAKEQCAAVPLKEVWDDKEATKSSAIQKKQPKQIISYLAFTFNPYINSRNIGFQSFHQFSGFDIHKISIGNYLSTDKTYYKTSNQLGYKLAKGLEVGYQFKKRKVNLYTGYFQKSMLPSDYTPYGRDERNEKSFYIGLNSPFNYKINKRIKLYYGVQLMFKESLYNASVSYQGWPPGEETIYSIKSNTKQFWLQGNFGVKKYVTKIFFFDAGISYNLMELSKINYISTSTINTTFPFTTYSSTAADSRSFFSTTGYLLKNGQFFNTLYLKIGIAITNKNK